MSDGLFDTQTKGQNAPAGTGEREPKKMPDRTPDATRGARYRSAQRGLLPRQIAEQPRHFGIAPKPGIAIFIVETKMFAGVLM